MPRMPRMPRMPSMPSMPCAWRPQAVLPCHRCARTHLLLTTYYLLLTTYYLLAYYYLPRQVRELAPACRYRVRLRATNEQGVSAWSAAVAVETDAADSAHRIQFEQMQVHEALGEGGFSIVYRGVYGKQQDGSVLQVALKQP